MGKAVFQSEEEKEYGGIQMQLAYTSCKIWLFMTLRFSTNQVMIMVPFAVGMKIALFVSHLLV